TLAVGDDVRRPPAQIKKMESPCDLVQLSSVEFLGSMLELEQALEQILAAVPAPVGESIALGEALGRVLTEPILSPIDLPVFDNSAMDGYAVRAPDLAAARVDAPVRLRVVGRVAAGESFSGEISSGSCVRLFTGSLLPRGADAVVMQEDTRVPQ